ncbi:MULTISPECIES: helix-turn-helix transcriptional regulator [unclassified Chryseobacterium]|uniref:helix-turn-helix domain-containing protein n=1 Tax=unclassified Chryseobacterium TaxID=2593645 RepID=UPI00226A0D21|nr:MULTISPECIES: helix-turn-helix transcriptional regulator [unclassified Chryseobacterium]
MSFFGTNIKKIRQVRGLSQKAFADLFELNRGVISSYEEGRAEPKIETLLKVADYFNLDLHNLLTETLQVNQLASGSDIDHLMFAADHLPNVVLHNDPSTVKMQKILANIDLVYEFSESNSLLSNYQYGDILFLNKADQSKDPFSTLIAHIDGNLTYYSEITENEIPQAEFYKIVGYISLAEKKNILGEILERLERLERK